MKLITNFFPQSILSALSPLSENHWSQLEEIRLRINRPIVIHLHQTTMTLPYTVTAADADQLMQRLAKFSIYTLDEELRKGYLTIEGGHRVGFAGKVILENGEVKAIRNVSSFNIRIARETKGVSNKLINYLLKEDKTWMHTMIIGPPQSGKTTLLRDLARIVSLGDKHAEVPPMKVGIVDERSEIAGSVSGVPQLSFGIEVDVLDACPKAEGMMMMIRSMSPRALVIDEVGRTEDIDAMEEAMHAGITLLSTVHGNSYEDIKKRPQMNRLLKAEAFERYIVVGRNPYPGAVLSILDKQGKPLKQEIYANKKLSIDLINRG
ncbi:stage III sporulation protein AA [Mangrovibacillus cuniculi]|uniref:Stage III sporulation protein AA n=1 Tax=Mangrovibacillus cuniculi TaxID=2593652 RepID=A0A7S8HFE9_9BACI|nr:stage III sporulation protein AA [Mangrovibacillus cuniculi]QPC46834.1 stage III sporulation protein AA [Mangrovibacillus cuniculi]